MVVFKENNFKNQYVLWNMPSNISIEENWDYKYLNKKLVYFVSWVL